MKSDDITINPSPEKTSKKSYRKGMTSFSDSARDPDMSEIKSLLKELVKVSKSRQVIDNSNVSNGSLERNSAISSALIPAEVPNPLIQSRFESKESPQEIPSNAIPNPVGNIQKKRSIPKTILRIAGQSIIVIFLFLASFAFLMFSKVNFYVNLFVSLVFAFAVFVSFYFIIKSMKHQMPYQNPQVIVGTSDIFNVNRCPKCNTKLFKSKVVSEGNRFHQFVKCRNPICNFQRDIFQGVT